MRAWRYLKGMSKILSIIGAGGHGSVVAEIAIAQNYDEVHFFDDKWPKEKKFGDYRIIDNIDSLISNKYKNCDIAIAIGDNKTRSKYHKILKERGCNLPVLKHPSAYISATANIDEGSIIFPHAIISANAHIAKGTIVNNGASVDHDCFVNNFVHISPRVAIGGSVNIGDFSWIGIGSSIKNNITIGKNVIVGAGSSVITNIKDNLVVGGVPSKIIRNREDEEN